MRDKIRQEDESGRIHGNVVFIYRFHRLLPVEGLPLLQRRQPMDVVGLIINLEGRVHISGELDQGSGLEHGGERAGGRLPGGVGNYVYRFLSRA